MTTGVTSSRWLLAGLVGLPALLTALWFGFKGLELFLVDMNSRKTAIVNLSEAVALNDRAATFRLLKKGMNPNQSYPVRAGMILDYPVFVTPLQAAIFTRQVDLFEQLTVNGAQITGESSRSIFCLALEVGAAELLLVILRTAGISPGTVDCEPQAALDQIRAQRVGDQGKTVRSD